MPETITVELGGEIEECTPQLQWVRNPFSGFPPTGDKLQQAWRIRVVDKDGRTMGSHIEWRDVPVVHKTP